MSETTTTAPPASQPREKLTKKAVTADHPTWCPGCGDFAVLASFYKVLEKRQLEHEKIVTLAGIGCSSRFPYFVNGHGEGDDLLDRKSTRLNSSHVSISYAVFCLKKKKKIYNHL